ncbi:PAS and ANTAR domain-containing protein [Nocardia sp. BMG111209]|uniref:PAS and ANTAR domain-containing protein n=1 Tax=Nocardia sp. BMG111209 TaxID=1160137 RepID=UPI0003799E05|nr:PAS and ANTAR domain-containing protein [Nocardia sp. BMG111209]
MNTPPRELPAHISSQNVRARTHSAAVGAFTFWFATRRWEWSTGVYLMHGYAPGEVEPTTELILSHKHPEDRDHVAELITRSVERGEPFSGRHRFLDTSGRVHSALVVADRILDDGAPTGTTGYYIDLTGTLDAAGHAAVSTALPEVVEARAVIEQAKGVLMLMYGIDADQAFEVLTWRSQETNTKLRAIATQLLADLSLVPRPHTQTVTAFDHILLTTHERIPPEEGPPHP